MDRIVQSFVDPIFVITLVLSLILGIAGNFPSDGIKSFYRRNSTKAQREYESQQALIEAIAQRCAAHPTLLQIEIADLAVANQMVISRMITIAIRYMGVLFLATYMNLRRPATNGTISDSLAQVFDTTNYQFSWSNFGSMNFLITLLFAWVVISAIRASFQLIPVIDKFHMHRKVVARTKQILLADLDRKNQANA